jgi:hypothetical protein
MLKRYGGKALKESAARADGKQSMMAVAHAVSGAQAQGRS